MTDARELLRAANPVPECPAPPIERFWARLDVDTEADGHTDQVPPARARAHGWVGRVVVGLAVAVTIAVGAGAIVVLHGHKGAAGGPAAAATTLPSPKLGLTGILGVLRRPQTKADLDPTLLRQLEERSAAPLGVLRSPVRDLIRLATITPWGDRVFLVPERWRTRAMIEKSLRRLKIPAARERQVRRLTGRGYALGLFVLGEGGAGGGCCDPAASIEAGAAVFESGPSPNSVVLVVPDGVAKVTVRLRHAVTATVHNNVAAFVVHQPVENLGNLKMTWYSSSGAILKRLGSAVPAASRARPAAAIDPMVAAQLSVLRRARTRADALPAAFSAQLRSEYASEHPDVGAARLVKASDGQPAYLVPASAGACVINANEAFCSPAASLPGADAVDLCSPMLPAGKLEIEWLLPDGAANVNLTMADGAAIGLPRGFNVYIARLPIKQALPKTIDWNRAGRHHTVSAGVPSGAQHQRCAHP